MVQSLSDRPTKLTMEWLLNKEVIDEEGNILEFNNENTFNFMLQMKNMNYVDEQFKITDRFVEDDAMYILSTKDFELCQLCDWQWLEGNDGKIIKDDSVSFINDSSVNYFLLILINMYEYIILFNGWT